MVSGVLLLARLIYQSIQVPLLVQSLWTRPSATMATAARLSEACIEMRSRKWKEARRKTLTNALFSLPRSANVPTWCGEPLPSLGGRTHAHRAGALPRTHRHTLRAVLGRGTDFSQLYFCERRLKGAHRVFLKSIFFWRTMDEWNFSPPMGFTRASGTLGWRFLSFASVPANMLERLSVSDFVVMTNEDLSSPGTSGFQSKMSDCRNTVSAVEEVRRGRAHTPFSVVYLFM